jgi:hypothetical protein
MEAERKGLRSDFLWKASNANLGAWYPLNQITMPQAEQAVAYLDSNHPDWDRKIWSESGIEVDALYDWFLPAVAATNPDAVKRDFRETLSFPLRAGG